MSWVKLERGDDWGAAYFARRALTRHGYASAARGLRIEKGDTVSIRWPDGSTETVTIDMLAEPGSYYDHGQTTRFTNQVPGFWSEFHGVRKFVRIDEVELSESFVQAREPKDLLDHQQ